MEISCMLYSHVHRDTSSLWLVHIHIVRYYDTVLCTPWYYTRSLPSVVYWQRECPLVKGKVQGIVDELAWGPCVHTWAVCREVLHIQFCPDWNRDQSHEMMFYDSSQIRLHVITLLDPSSGVTYCSGVTYWVFLKIIKWRATLTFQV